MTVSARVDFNAFVRRWDLREGDPTVSAAMDDLLGRMGAVEAAIGRPITEEEWLDDWWMAGHGLVAAIDRLIAAVNAGDGG